MKVGMRIPGLNQPAFQGRYIWRKSIRALLLLTIGFTLMAPSEALAYVGVVQVRNMGLSRVRENTFLTILLDRAVNPRVSPFTGTGRAQLIVEFPKAQSGKLPERLAGDDVLVKNVRTEATPDSVKIIMEMFPDRPYRFSREIRPGSGQTAIFRLRLWADPEAPREEKPPPAYAPEPQEPLVTRVPETQEPPEPSLPERPEPAAPRVSETPEPLAELPPEQPAAPPVMSVAPTGTFNELYQLMPKAKGLLEFLRGEGWTIAEAKSYDRPGQRFSRGFTLTNGKYPEMAVRIAHLPPNAPQAPTINIIDLAMENLQGEAPNKYRELRQWNFAKIKGKFEDIGDFFDDALKPLRVEIRQKCQEGALRYSHLITNFLSLAAPRNPQIAKEAIADIRKKVSPRFEGVQYTLSEDPLIILNLVDFLYLRIYYVGSH